VQVQGRWFGSFDLVVFWMQVQGRWFGSFDLVVFGCRCRVGGLGVLTWWFSGAG
jgi:hypothetical protein